MAQIGFWVKVSVVGAFHGCFFGWSKGGVFFYGIYSLFKLVKCYVLLFRFLCNKIFVLLKGFRRSTVQTRAVNFTCFMLWLN